MGSETANMASSRRLVLLLSVLLPASSFVMELDDSFMDSRDAHDIWLIKFYAPWCWLCKQLDPTWSQLGAELRSLGSPVLVGKVDATKHTGLAREFGVRQYPSIFVLKKDSKYEHKGARGMDAILEFTNRVAGPLVRALITPQLFQYAVTHNDVLIVYIGATSPLKGNYTSVAEELITHTSFYSASRDVLPGTVSLPTLPAVLIFKDGTHLTYNELRDGTLRSWINKERFLGYMKIDSYTLYNMGDTGKLVALALVEQSNPSEKGHRYKALLQRVADGHTELYSSHFHFGFMEGADYINGLIMGEVVLPCVMVVNLSNDGYFLPPADVETERDLMLFLDRVLDGGLQSQGGNDLFQRLRRLVYEIRILLMPVFQQAPVLSCSLLGVCIAAVAALVYLFCRAPRPEDADPAPSRQRQQAIKKKA